MAEYSHQHQYPEFAFYGRGYPADDLRSYSFHTGAPLRPIDPEERCPVLFRDLGIIGMNLFLNGRLKRLAGPLSPITYMRTKDFQEPYIDYGRIGRLVLLRPFHVHPWHSGMPSVYVAHSSRLPEADAIGLVPGYIEIEHAARVLALAKNVSELREAFGQTEYDDAVAETRNHVRLLIQEMATIEEYAEPLRKNLKSLDPRRSAWAQEVMMEHAITEGDLCCAWNHIPEGRRRHLHEEIRKIDIYAE